ncbi:hypothetical protein EVAR_26059_1 [Eumeta japonica]|uniref:Uncharacterized protein n=1 Tax=Eumeta variegata TaxID=151549 RepID=A0A4C1VPD5_EUMVA|nr:hypothetical protein EVAR_26059_1 [Eumeta japonica]
MNHRLASAPNGRATELLSFSSSATRFELRTARSSCRGFLRGALKEHLATAGTIATASMDKKRFKAFLTEHGHLDLLRYFEVYCSSPASSDQPNSVSDSDVEAESKPSKEPTKWSAATRPSENSNLEWSDDSDEYSDFTLVQRWKTFSVRPEAASFLTQATDGVSYLNFDELDEDIPAFRSFPVRNREKLDKFAVPASTKNSNKKKSDGADVTTFPISAPRGPKRPLVFLQNKDWWTELRKNA